MNSTVKVSLIKYSQIHLVRPTYYRKHYQGKNIVYLTKNVVQCIVYSVQRKVYSVQFTGLIFWFDQEFVCFLECVFYSVSINMYN